MKSRTLGQCFNSNFYNVRVIFTIHFSLCSQSGERNENKWKRTLYGLPWTFHNSIVTGKIIEIMSKDRMTRKVEKDGKKG